MVETSFVVLCEHHEIQRLPMRWLPRCHSRANRAETWACRLHLVETFGAAPEDVRMPAPSDQISSRRSRLRLPDAAMFSALPMR